jgi:hypothetical protein
MSAPKLYGSKINFMLIDEDLAEIDAEAAENLAAGRPGATRSDILRSAVAAHVRTRRLNRAAGRHGR